VRAWLWSTTADQQAVPRPSDEPDQRLAGPDPFEVLLVGSGAASSWGVLSYSLGLPGALARGLRTSTERGVVVRTLIDPGMTAAAASGALRTARTPFDAVRIVVLGVNEALEMVDLREWRRLIEDLLDALEPTAEHPAVVAGVQPISSIPVFAGGLSSWLDRQAAAMNRETAAACATRPHTTFAPLSAPPRASIARYRGSADYHFWAHELVPSAVALLPSRAGRSRTPDPGTELRRREELARLGIHGLRNRFVIDDVVQAESKLFGSQSAGLLILEQDRAWFYTGIGVDRTEVDRQDSFTSYAIDSSEDLVVTDAFEDERFRNYRHVIGPPYMRFYAGHPIEGPTGQRIAVLCIYDQEPREFDEASRELLGRLALQIQDCLHHEAE
jgi:hypothetical protein